MKTVKWLVVVLAVAFLGCMQPDSEVNNGCYIPEERADKCEQMFEDSLRAWESCYDGSDPSRDELLRKALDNLFYFCIETDCLNTEDMDACLADYDEWYCMDGEDLGIPFTCSLALGI